MKASSNTESTAAGTSCEKLTQRIWPTRRSLRCSPPCGLFDSNNNGKWDPGNYKQKIQPEQAITIDKKLNIIKEIRYVYQNKVDANREDLISILIVTLIMIEVFLAMMK